VMKPEISPKTSTASSSTDEERLRRVRRRHLPSLGSFATFEVVAKHLSFTLAAKELNVTQAAVSQHVRNLEKSLGRALFVRKHKSLDLTSEGARVLEAVTRGLDIISAASVELEKLPGEDIITVSATTGVAAHWLKPLADKFREKYPRIKFVIFSSDEDDTLRNFYGVDISIICGSERCAPGEEIYYLFPEIVRPVCSPSYLEKFGPFSDVKSLTNANLLHLHDTHWRADAIGWLPLTWKTWFEANGVDYFFKGGTLETNSYPLLIDAAIAGEGVILGWQHMVQHHLNAERLVLLSDSSFRTERINYLKIGEHSKSRQSVIRFGDFLRSECKKLEKW